jgi:release factor glutamine methyltransferase
MKSINDILRYGESLLEEVTPDFKIDAKYLLEYVLACDSLYLFMNKDKAVTEEEKSQYLQLISRRKKHEPLQYIIGSQSFMGLDFNVRPGCLIPRSDTEPLVEAVLSRGMNKKTLLDIGSGSGAIHISIAYTLRQMLCTAVDISEKALEISEENAKKHGVLDRINYVKSNLFEQVNEKYDIIVSNPPYIPTKVIEGLQDELFHEPFIALDGGEDGYDFYRTIISQARDYLNDDGLIVLEVGHDQARTIEVLLKDNGYHHIEIIKDLSQIERVVLARYERI